MPETSLYIWYHADPALEPALHAWLGLVRDRLGYAGGLLRRDSEDKTTYMETYEHVGPEAAARIEALAAAQSWFTDLHSPRRCEAFMPLLHT
jgi:hypothetical protein